LDPGLKHQACGQVQRKILERHQVRAQLQEKILERRMKCANASAT
jgi:hypothetical protein